MAGGSMKLTEKAVGSANVESYVLVTQKELPSDYVITGNEEEGELDAMKIESVRRIPTAQMVEMIQDNLEIDDEPTDESDALITSGSVKAELDRIDEALDSYNEDITNIDNILSGDTSVVERAVPLTDFTIAGFRISPSGTYKAQNQAGYFIELDGVSKVCIKGNATKNSEYAFLSAYSPTDETHAPIVGTTTTPTSIELDTTVTVDVPSTATWLYCNRRDSSGNVRDPQTVSFFVEETSDSLVGKVDDIADSIGDLSELETTVKTDLVSAINEAAQSGGSSAELEEDVEQLRTDVDSLDAQINGGSTLSPVTVDIATTGTEIGFYISTSNGQWTAQNRRGYIIALNSAEKVKLTASSYNAEYAFLSSNSPVADTSAPIVGGSLPSTLTANANVELDVPTGALYLYCRRLNSSGYNCTLSELICYIRSQSGDSIATKVAKIDQLETDFTAIADDYEEVTENLPFIYDLDNKTINTSGEISDSTKFLLSDVIHVQSGQTFAITLPYAARVVYFSDEGETVQSVTNWANSYTFSQDKYIRLHFRNHLHQNDDLTAEEVTDKITTDVMLPKTFIPVASKADLRKFEQFNLNQPFVGKEDMMWNWWSYPQIASFKGVRDKLYWTYTTHKGYSGVASYDFDTHEIVKNNLKLGDGADDHNNSTVYILSDGTVLVVYTEGHYSNHKLYVRRSTAPESVESFEDAIEIDTLEYVSYARILEYDGTLYMFYRSKLKEWNYMTSTDGGRTWGSETIMISAAMQYYCLVMPTTTDGVFRIVMYSNPNESDPNIRLGFFHCSNNGIYNADNSTLLGTSSVAATSFTTIIAVDSGKTQRLLDCAVTAPSVTRVLYCPFTEQADGTDESELIFDAVYKIYDSGNTITVGDAGYTIWKQRYQGGASWIDDSSFVLSRCDGTYDYIETYSLSGSSVTKTKEVHKEAIGTLPIRNARPIADVNGKAVMWWRGYYNRNDYRDFNTDAEMEILTS